MTSKVSAKFWIHAGVENVRTTGNDDLIFPMDGEEDVENNLMRMENVIKYGVPEGVEWLRIEFRIIVDDGDTTRELFAKATWNCPQGYPERWSVEDSYGYKYCLYGGKARVTAFLMNAYLVNFDMGETFPLGYRDRDGERSIWVNVGEYTHPREE